VVPTLAAEVRRGCAVWDGNGLPESEVVGATFSSFLLHQFHFGMPLLHPENTTTANAMTESLTIDERMSRCPL
jgi:hypothetical protein